MGMSFSVVVLVVEDPFFIFFIFFFKFVEFVLYHE